MIVARDSKVIFRFFNRYLTWQLKKNFSCFWLVNSMPKTNPSLPLVLTPNHISWWDGFILYYSLYPLPRRQFRIMMLEEQLKRYRFFSGLGAFSIQPDKPKALRETIRYFHMLLAEPDTLIGMYPQGKMEPYWKRPHDLKHGITRMLVREYPAEVVPVACLIHPHTDKKPEIVVRFGECMSSNTVLDDFESYASIYHDNLAQCDRAVIDRDFLIDCMPLLGRKCTISV